MLSDGESPDGSRTVPLTSLVGLAARPHRVVSALSPEVPTFDPFVPFALGTNGSGTIVMNVVLADARCEEGIRGVVLYGVDAGDECRGSGAEGAAGDDQQESSSPTPASWGAFMVWGGK